VLSTVRQILNERISDVEKDINFSDWFQKASQ
jgi:hypothetical protein